MVYNYQHGGIIILHWGVAMARQEKIQVPLSSELKQGLKAKANDLGFSSSNEAVRLLIHNFVQGNITMHMHSNQPTYKMQLGPTEILDANTEIRLGKALEEYKNGEYITLDMNEPGAIDRLLNIEGQDV